MTSIISRVKFEVSLNITKITRVPQTTGSLQVRWNVTDSPRRETRGKTASASIQDHGCVFDYDTSFSYTIGIAVPSRRLRSSTIVLEVFWRPPGADKMSLGSLSLDLAQFVNRPAEPLAFLLDNSRVNCLLFLQLSLEQIKGPTDFVTPPFTAPIIKTDIASGIGLGQVTDATNSKATLTYAASRLLEKPAYIHFLKGMKESPYHLNPIATINDLFRGGNGFENLKPPPVPVVDKNSDDVPTEEGIRDGLISWALTF